MRRIKYKNSEVNSISYIEHCWGISAEILCTILYTLFKEGFDCIESSLTKQFNWNGLFARWGKCCESSVTLCTCSYQFLPKCTCSTLWIYARKIPRYKALWWFKNHKSFCDYPEHYRSPFSWWMYRHLVDQPGIVATFLQVPYVVSVYPLLVHHGLPL